MEVCSPQTVSNFSAVAYFFARKLYKELNIPIGIINSSWGGTDIESWTSANMFEQLPASLRARYQSVDAKILSSLPRRLTRGKLLMKKRCCLIPEIYKNGLLRIMMIRSGSLYLFPEYGKMN